MPRKWFVEPFARDEPEVVDWADDGGALVVDADEDCDELTSDACVRTDCETGELAPPEVWRPPAWRRCNAPNSSRSARAPMGTRSRPAAVVETSDERLLEAPDDEEDAPVWGATVAVVGSFVSAVFARVRFVRSQVYEGGMGGTS